MPYVRFIPRTQHTGMNANTYWVLVWWVRVRLVCVSGCVWYMPLFG